MYDPGPSLCFAAGRSGRGPHVCSRTSTPIAYPPARPHLPSLRYGYLSNTKTKVIIVLRDVVVREDKVKEVCWVLPGWGGEVWGRAG